MPTDYDRKLTITLRLTDEEADQLMTTLDVGACNRYAPDLQRASHAIKKYVGKRVDAAVFARRRARLRVDRRKIATAYMQEVTRDSARAKTAGEPFDETRLAAIRAEFYPAKVRSDDDV